jgi:hypothetical protein
MWPKSISEAEEAARRPTSGPEVRNTGTQWYGHAKNARTEGAEPA